MYGNVGLLLKRTNKRTCTSCFVGSVDGLKILPALLHIPSADQYMSFSFEKLLLWANCVVLLYLSIVLPCLVFLSISWSDWSCTCTCMHVHTCIYMYCVTATFHYPYKAIVFYIRTGSKLGIPPLMLAAMNGHTSTVKLLLDMGSDINAQVQCRYMYMYYMC